MNQPATGGIPWRVGVASMRRCFGGKGFPCSRLTAALMIAVGLAILLFCVPYWFWAAIFGMALTILGIILWNV